MTEPVALFSDQQPVDDLPRDQRPQNPRFGRRRVQEPHQAHRGVQQVRVQRAHVKRSHVALAPRGEMTRLHYHRADESRVKVQAEAQIRPFRERVI